MKQAQDFLHLLTQAIPPPYQRLHTLELDITGWLVVVVWVDQHQREIFKFDQEDLECDPLDLAKQVVEEVAKLKVPKKEKKKT